MKISPLIYFLSLCCPFAEGRAQVNENFNDGDFHHNPAWAGDSASWIVTAGELQSQSSTTNNVFYLSTSNTLALETEWEFLVRVGFNTSSLNYVDIYLVASHSELPLAGTTGYFVRIGNTQDEIALYRKDAGGNMVKLIDGVDGTTGSSDNSLRIKVLRKPGYVFVLYSDDGGSGNNYVLEGTATDSVYTTSLYCGILVHQSSSAFFQKHYLDDLRIGVYVPDYTAPSLLAVHASASNRLVLLFSEPVLASSIPLPDQYTLTASGEHPSGIEQDGMDGARLWLLFNSNFQPGLSYEITVSGIRDLSGNNMGLSSKTFIFHPVAPNDIVISEIFPDPLPAQGLPPSEFLELKNRSGHTIDLSGWKMRTPSGISTALPFCLLPADSFVIITPAPAASLFQGPGMVLGLTVFPSLDNAGDTVWITGRTNETIHAVDYTNEWYGNELKKNGGWSLEIRDPDNPCGGQENWKASIHPSGGTPGRENSVHELNPDKQRPRLSRTYSPDSQTLVAVFDETLDSSAASGQAGYHLSPSVAIQEATASGPLFREVKLVLAAPMEQNEVYLLQATGLKDCAGHTIGTYNTTKAGVPSPAEKEDLVINEILFNPKPFSFDFVELFNRSNKIIDVSRIFIAGRNVSGSVSDIEKLSKDPYYLFPGDYLVVNEEAANVHLDYFVQKPEWIRELPSFPSLPDDNGTILIMDEAGNILDEVRYSADWHFALLNSTEAVSLERIDPGSPAQDRANWHSASSGSGYATPTYRNSQYRKDMAVQGSLQFGSKMFSPDNDGVEDIAMLHYMMEEGGFTANLRIFNAGGLMIRHLVKNELMGTRGKWTWDGLNEKQEKVPQGIYIFQVEIFNLQGRKKSFRESIVLAGKF